MNTTTAAKAPAPRTFLGATIDRLSPGVSHRYAAFTAQQWVYGDSLAEIKQAIRDIQGVGRQRNGHTYLGGHAGDA